jgi:hypothetical protein
MTLDEAKAVAMICTNADGGCSHCVSELFEMLNNTFHEFEFTVINSYMNECSVVERKPLPDML